MQLTRNHLTFKSLNPLFVVAWLASLLVITVPVHAGPQARNEAGSRFFIQNAGQFDSDARFVLDGRQSRLWLAEDGLWLTWLDAGAGSQAAPSDNGNLAGINLHLRFVGADPQAQPRPIERLETRLNYLIGEQELSAPTWTAVAYRALYPGIDLLIEAPSDVNDAELLSWRLLAQPGADLSQVRLQIAGADRLQVAADHLVFETPFGELALPLIETQAGGSAGWRLDAPQVSVVGRELFEIGMPLAEAAPRESVANQASAGGLAYSTFLGGSAWDAGYALALGADGSIYVAGRTASTDFPTTPGVFDRRVAQVDAFIARLDPSGGRLAYATILGGKGMDAAYGIALIGDQATVTGETQSADFPTTGSAFDATCGSDGTCDAGSQGPFSDAFLAQVNADGSRLAYSTYLGGEEEDSGYSVAADDQRVYLTGITYSPDFPAAGYKANGDAFVISFEHTRKLAYASLLGGSDVDAGFAIDVYKGEAFITGETSSPDFPAQTYQGGRDMVLARLDAAGSLVNASLVGRAGDERGNAIDLDADGNIAISGLTTSDNLPASAGAYGGGGDTLVLQADPQGTLSDLVYFGGTGYDEGRGVAFSATGGIWITGFTTSTDFPITAQAFQLSPGGEGDAFLVNLDLSAAPAAQLSYSSYLGGAGEDSGQALAFFQADQVYLAGYTLSEDFPLTSTNLASALNGPQDVFISSLIASGAPGPIPTVSTWTSTPVPPTLTATPEVVSQATTAPTSGLIASVEATTTGDRATAPPGTPSGVAVPTTAPGVTGSPIQAVQATQVPVVQQTPETGVTKTPAPATPAGTAIPGLESEMQPDAGWLWLIVPVSLAVIGLAGWLIYRRKRK